MKRQVSKKIIGIVSFIFICIAICFIVDQTSVGRVQYPKTYGEYEEQKNIWNQEESLDVTAMEGENKEAARDADIERKELTKTAFLTFDDGPSKNTEKVLDILKEYQIKATFFIVAQEITPEREAIVNRMIKEGHVVGIHTYNHNYKKIYKSKQSCLEDILKSSERIEEATGIAPRYYRFPYGSANCYISGFCNDIIEELNNRNIQYIDWNVSGEDAIGKPTSYSIMKNIRSFDRYMEPVILLHDGQSNGLTAKVLPQIIEKIKKEGYGFGTIDQRSKPYQWSHGWKKN